MINHKTSRGFNYYSFKDTYDTDCSIQKSSSVESRIWLGCDDIDLKALIPGKGWTNINLNSKLDIDLTNIPTVGNTRMHLDRKQVLKLLPILIKFVITGKI